MAFNFNKPRVILDSILEIFVKRKSMRILKLSILYFLTGNLRILAVIACQPYSFKVKDIRRLYNLIRKFPPYVHICFAWNPAHVGILGNENVDKLAKAALNRASSSGKLICWSDLKPKVNWDAKG
ncbi:hypothetical protein PoB_004138300 [Plakobranchus ocellatus]|uniref:RNase H type-1 domain-containing protein n=1 Tax=Plakobranchus ocellatus TaxID=259542 RepID=A0AAV4B7U0_9GAST|nr:hypothetical protein PoB_004138300 [Plakobranchus ocellatus]